MGESRVRNFAQMVTVLALCFLWFALPVLAEPARDIPSKSSLDAVAGSLEERVRALQENQKTMIKKQEQIKSELRNLKTWINRRR